MSEGEKTRLRINVRTRNGKATTVVVNKSDFDEMTSADFIKVAEKRYAAVFENEKRKQTSVVPVHYFVF